MIRSLIVLFILNIYFFHPSIVAAQTATLAPVMDLGSVADQLEVINKSNLPYGVSFDDNTTNISTPPAAAIGANSEEADAAHQYSITSSRCTPQTETTQNQNFLQKVLAFFKDLFTFGNKKAYESLGCLVPQGTVESQASIKENIVAGEVQPENNSTDVLGIFNREADMENSLPRMRCAALPYGAMDCPGIK